MSDEPQPVPPEDVSVLFSDGSRIPLECVYRGRDPECGCHMWQNPVPLFFTEEMLGKNPRLHVGVLPAGSEVRLSYAIDEVAP